MAELNQELGRAVEEVLEWLGTSPELAAAALGINASTLHAMRQGIVPMRSLVIRFAEGIGRRCGERGGGQEWWTDVDAWLDRAGYQARRDVTPGFRPRNQESPAPEAPPERKRIDTFHEPPPSFPRTTTPARPSPPHTPGAAPAPSPDEPPAGSFYRPVYEREPWGDTFVHVFWIVDPEGNRVFRRHMNLSVDYKAEAARLKQDLAHLPRAQFERKYGRFRVQKPE